MIHPTALVHPEAQLDPSVEVGPWCVIGPQVSLGAGTRLHSHVVIEGKTRLGERNVVFPFAVLGAIPQDLKYRGENTELQIGNDNTLREGVTLNLGTVQGGGVTRVGNQNLIMASTHLGHDCQVGNFCVISNSCGLAGHVTLEDYSILGGMTGVAQFVRIGAHSYIAGYSAIERDILPFATAMGGRPCVLKSVNAVGLKRRGFHSEQLQKIHEALRLWMRSELSKEACVEAWRELAHTSQSQEVSQMVDFVKKSEVGVLR